MKIIHLIWQLQVGGAEAMLVDIVNEQSLLAGVTLIVGNALIDNVLASRLSARVELRLVGRPEGSRNPLHILRLYHLLNKLKPDIVHAHQPSFIRILRFLRFPRVLTLHTTGMQLPQQVQKFDAVYGISDAVKNDVNKRHPRLLTRVIHNGIGLSSIRQKTIYGHSPFRIVQVGRLDHHLKGQDILLRAIKKVGDEWADARVTVDFIGDGPSKDYLLGLANELGVGERCRFLGTCGRDYVYENLCSYDLLVQPSRVEGFGLAAVEAMAAGVPVLVSNIEGPMEVIEGGRYGVFFRDGDADDCAKQILDIMRRSALPEFSAECKQAEQYARSEFDVSVAARRYLTDYARVIASKRTSASNI